MNRKILVLVGIVFISIFNIGYLSGQIPIVGFNEVTRGTDMGTVIQYYPGGEVLDSSFYFQKDVSGLINERWFFFHQDRLYDVVEHYYEISEKFGKVLYEDIIKTYGKFDKHSNSSDADNTGKSFLKKYDKDLLIELCFYIPKERKNNSTVSKIKEGSLKGIWGEFKEGQYYFYVTILYSNPTVVKELREVKKDKKQLVIK
jgi:hypothetical protein